MTLDTTLSATIRTHLLSFVINAFQSLDSGIVRKECAPLVSISIWHNLSTEKKRERKLDQSVQVRKAWRAAAKRESLEERVFITDDSVSSQSLISFINSKSFRI
jgi:intron-binding protein aquarius